MINYYFNEEQELRPFTFEAEANEGSEAPRNALRVAPEFKEGMWPCEDGGKWVLVEDNRGKTAFSTTDKTLFKIVDYVGAVEDGYTLLEPTSYYDTWDGKKWVLTEEGQAQKDAAEKDIKVAEAKSLLIEAGQQIEILQDQIVFEDYENAEEKASLEAELKSWKKYRISLNKFINRQIEEFPEK